MASSFQCVVAQRAIHKMYRDITRQQPILKDKMMGPVVYRSTKTTPAHLQRKPPGIALFTLSPPQAYASQEVIDVEEYALDYNRVLLMAAGTLTDVPTILAGLPVSAAEQQHMPREQTQPRTRIQSRPPTTANNTHTRTGQHILQPPTRPKQDTTFSSRATMSRS